MSRRLEEEEIRRLEARGIKGVHSEDWTPELALSVLRENRRRYAREPWMQATSALAARMAEELLDRTGVIPADISAVLLAAGAKLATLAVVDGVPAPVLAEIMQCAADDLDQQARAGEQP